MDAEALGPGIFLVLIFLAFFILASLLYRLFSVRLKLF